MHASEYPRRKFKKTGRKTIGFRCYCALAFIILGIIPVGQAEEGSFRVLSYHDVVLSRDELMSDSVTLDHLVNQFEWLLAEGYHPVGIDDILVARQGGKPLPAKAILLTFDDGYISFYDHVLPLLKAYQYPAVLALVGSWMETAAGDRVDYGVKGMPREAFLSWDQVVEIEKSGLVEIASHSYDLHREILVNPQGNKLAAASSLKYDDKTGTHESLPAYRERIRSDLAQAQANFKERIGHPARVMVWPYGRYTDIAVEAGVEQGFEMAFTLDREPGRLDDLEHMGRYYVAGNPTPMDFRNLLESPMEKIVGRFPLLETSTLHAGEDVGEENLSAWLERCSIMKPDGVCIRPYEYRDGQPVGSFPSRQLPVAGDRLLRLVWQTRVRGRSRPLLWLVNDRKEWGWSDAEMIQTWPELGPAAPVHGLVIGGAELTPAILKLPWYRFSTGEDPLEDQSPGMRRRRRQQCLETISTDSGFAGQVLTKLESFQSWQPYTRVHLELPWQRAREMDNKELRALLMAFDRLVLDARGIPLRDLWANLRARPLQPLLATHGQLLVDFEYPGKGSGDRASRRLAKKLAGVEDLGILSWIYDHDWPLEDLPSGGLLRLMMSSEYFPWHEPGFRRWQAKRQKETPPRKKP